jgi:hypothetical protein
VQVLFNLRKETSRVTFDEKDTKARSKYDKSHENSVTWELLDQDQRAWWRALGLGVDRSKCDGANTKVTTDSKCISGRDGCTRVNYHTAKRWENDGNNDMLAKQRFDARNFSVIFFKYECETAAVNAAGKLEWTDLTVPNISPLTWDDIDAAGHEDGRFMTAATNLGYDEDEWKAHGSAPDRPEGPPDNLVLVVENYLEGESENSLFFFTQVICIVIMVAVSIHEIRHVFLWWHQTKTKSEDRVFKCDRSYQVISDERYHKRRSNPSYDLCKAEFDKLKDEEKEDYEKIPKKRQSYWTVIRSYSGTVVLLQYIVIPVLTMEVSALLILESANVLDCIKDTVVSFIYKRLHARTRSCVAIFNFIPRSHVSTFSLQPQPVQTRIQPHTGAPLPAGRQQLPADPECTGIQKVDNQGLCASGVLNACS